MGKLTIWIYDTHHNECFIQGLLPWNRIPLMQQKIDILRETLEQVMGIEAMLVYPENTKSTIIKISLYLS